MKDTEKSRRLAFFFVLYNLIRDLRNRRAHSTDQLHGDDVEEFLRMVEELVTKVKKL
jgi:hypothetical protein